MLDPLSTLISDNTQLSSPKQKLVLTAPLSADLQSIAPAQRAPSLAKYLEAATSLNTRRAYQGDLADFEHFGGRIPCSAEELADYIAFRSATNSHYTVARRVVGICRAHKLLGFADPSKNDLVRTVMRGARRTHGSHQRRARPLLRDELSVVLPRGGRPIDVRDRAVMLVGFAAALRRSELVSLDISDLEWVGEGLLLSLRRSKTDQDGAGRKIAVPYGRTTLCAAKAVREWLALLPTGYGPLFVAVDKSGRLASPRLTAGAVNAIIKRSVKAAGFDPSAYSAHSLRAGLVTSAALAGADLHKIMEQTGHRSLEMLTRYIRDARLFEGNAAGAVL